MTMQKKLLILLFMAVAGGVAQANDVNIEQATSMSEVVRMLHEQEKASRPAQKPVSEMSDEEVLAQAAEKASDTVVNIGVGALSAVERFQKKAISAAANAVLAKTAIQYIALPRPLICEPNLINRWQSGDIRPSTCVSCNACYGTLRHVCIFADGR